MTREERRRLLVRLKMDPHGFAEQARDAVLTGDSEFLSKAAEVVKRAREELEAAVGKLTPPSRSEYPKFNERVQAAFADLFFKHGPNQVSLSMIQKAVDPKIALSNYSTAAKEIGARHLLKRARRKAKSKK
jgi:hypothetical protein